VANPAIVVMVSSREPASSAAMPRAWALAMMAHDLNAVKKHLVSGNDRLTSG